MGQDSTGKKIKEAREKAGLTQSQLAEAVGTTSQNISQYERGLRKPKYETLLKIAKALNVEWYSLFLLLLLMQSLQKQELLNFIRQQERVWRRSTRNF